MLRIIRYLAATLILLLLIPVAAQGAQSNSANYQVNEVFFGAGGSLDNVCSTTYCAKQSVGETGVGNTKGTAYQAQAGFNTDRTPYIQFVVNTSSINLGVVSPGTPATGNATFKVKTYLAGGYVVVNASPPPTNNSYTIATPTGSYSSGTEQFGINLVANTSPTTFGAAPVQVPGSTYSFGVAATGYNTSNSYKYANGDTIASSPSSSGETDYTISYLFNVTNITPGGTYTMNHILVATSTY